jgi:hypothetical protein
VKEKKLRYEETISAILFPCYLTGRKTHKQIARDIAAIINDSIDKLRWRWFAGGVCVGLGIGAVVWALNLVLGG